MLLKLKVHLNRILYYRQIKDHPTQMSSDGAVSVSDVMITTSGDDDDTKSVLITWSHQVSWRHFEKIQNDSPKSVKVVCIKSLLEE